MDELMWSIDDVDPTTLTVSGALTLRSATALGGLMYELLMDRGRLLVDVADVVVRWPAAVTVFPTALARTGAWPLARLALFDDRGSVASALRALGATAEVPLSADRAGALADLTRRPPRIHRCAELPSGPAAPGYARALVRAACSDWQIREEIDDRSRHLAGRPSSEQGQSGEYRHAADESTRTADMLSRHLRDRRPLGVDQDGLM